MLFCNQILSVKLHKKHTGYFVYVGMYFLMRICMKMQETYL